MTRDTLNEVARSHSRRIVPRARNVWMYRRYGTDGGHLKHSHYHDHIRQLPGFSPNVVFADGTTEPQLKRMQRLWSGSRVDRWMVESGDLLFLAGTDREYVDQLGIDSSSIPTICLVQGLRHADPGRKTYQYLSRKAVRVCVSEAVADAISATGVTNGPVLTIPNGTELDPFSSVDDGSPRGFRQRPDDVGIIGYKSPALARRLAARLDDAGVNNTLHLKFRDRATFLASLRSTRVAVCLPFREEGFYLTALEAMASGCLVVTTDCIGNRGYCDDGVNCTMVPRNCHSLFEATQGMLFAVPQQRRAFHAGARDTVLRCSLEAERRQFHAMLKDIDHVWRRA